MHMWMDGFCVLKLPHNSSSCYRETKELTPVDGMQCQVSQATQHANPAFAMKQKESTSAPQLPGLVARLLAHRSSHRSPSPSSVWFCSSSPSLTGAPTRRGSALRRLAERTWCQPCFVPGHQPEGRGGEKAARRSQAGFWSGKGSVIYYLCSRTGRSIINTFFESCR